MTNTGDTLRQNIARIASGFIPLVGRSTLDLADAILGEIERSASGEQAVVKIKKLEEENEKHAAAWNNMLALLEDAPEINPSNYDHDQVCLLNRQVQEAWHLANDMHTGKALDGLGGVEATPQENSDGR